MANTLLLRLEGPLQSWGERARWSVRDSSPEPTKSGVVGLLACALGWSTDDELRTLADTLTMGVRCDRPGTPLVDYHTVVGGVMSAEGKVKRNANTHEPETVVSWRHYLSDASFLVAVQCQDADLIARLADAVQNPQWLIYLGRKSCPPTRPPYVGVNEFDSLEDALKALPARSRSRATTVQLRAVVERLPGTGTRRRDQTDSRSRRTFRARYTEDITVTVPVEMEQI